MANTPMMIQYNDIKKKHEDAILFFRLGDFYEMFNDDAIVASKTLSLTLTGRGKDENRIPMCGVPFHAAESYVSKLVRHGYKVAICEQMDVDPNAKGPAPRDVVRVVTPGTAQLDTVLDASVSNYLVAVCKSKQLFGLACIDASTGHFTCDTYSSLQDIQNELIRYEVAEVLVDDAIMDDIIHSSKRSFFPYDIKQAEAVILAHFNIQSTASFKIDQLAEAYPAIVAILDYLSYTQKGAFNHIQKITPMTRQSYCAFDQGVIEHLDVFKKKVGLFDFLNYTATSMGARRLREWVRAPLVDIEKIQIRQQQVSQLLKSDQLSQWGSIMEPMNDIERVVSKICLRYNNPKDMVALKTSLELIPTIRSFIESIGGHFDSKAQALTDAFDHGDRPLKQVLATLRLALGEDVPNHCRDGGIFKAGYSQPLDDLCNSFQDIRNWIQQLEPRLREQLDIKSLKVGFNKVFGYYIEIPNAHKDKVPNNFIRKQTLTKSERYMTATLKEKETIILNAKEEQAKIEKKEYDALVQLVDEHVCGIQKVADIIADIDAIQSLATVAMKHQLSRPDIMPNSSNELLLDGLWYPMVAKHQRQSFIRNCIHMTKAHPFMLITGPNMAGKSTVMRSVAIAIIMGQMGSYVPAEVARFSVVDSLFTRIGANDKLTEGQSTFMVEMIETATICQNATENSLILLDEIGRGTSTFDGVSIAASVTEYLVSQVQARTLFATHYHELTTLSHQYSQIQNTSMQIKDNGHELVFTYKLIPGAAEKSYGVMVAKMAGLPKEVTDKAEEWLSKFEEDALEGHGHQLRLF